MKEIKSRLRAAWWCLLGRGVAYNIDLNGTIIGYRYGKHTLIDKVCCRGNSAYGYAVMIADDEDDAIRKLMKAGIECPEGDGWKINDYGNLEVYIGSIPASEYKGRGAS